MDCLSLFFHCIEHLLLACDCDCARQKYKIIDYCECDTIWLPAVFCQDCVSGNMCSIKNDAVPAEVDEKQSIVPKTLNFAQ